ncbi:MAG: ribonuclease T [Acidithiobacillus sp.]|jgi:ribonuclease T|uniref:ribonuclease T n=1 Tax=Acidithiobacillus sp. TaxID=1872118 RepID=UPI00355D791D
MAALAGRFRGFLPVVVDVETAGFDSERNALLEVAAIIIGGEVGQLRPVATHHFQVQPFAGAVLDPAALAFTGIDPFQALRGAVSEEEALRGIFRPVRTAVKVAQCRRAILVGHNAAFDLSFIKAAEKRTGVKNNPFHLFSTFDTVSLAGLAYGETVLAKAALAAGLDWDHTQAHSALYDARQTAELFCWIVNRYDLNREYP